MIFHDNDLNIAQKVQAPHKLIMVHQHRIEPGFAVHPCTKPFYTDTLTYSPLQGLLYNIPAWHYPPFHTISPRTLRALSTPACISVALSSPQEKKEGCQFA